VYLPCSPPATRDDYIEVAFFSRMGPLMETVRVASRSAVGNALAILTAVICARAPAVVLAVTKEG